MRILATLWVIGIGLLGVGLSQSVSAARYESPNYTIDASVGNSFGGDSSSSSYKLTSSGGESIIGNGEGGSYKLGQGYVAQLERAIQLTVDQPSIDFGGQIISGISRDDTAVVSILTDAPGYTISVQQDNDLTLGSDTVPAISSGTIASPSTWSEGTTKGLGFTLDSASATPPGVKWSSGNAYAALPNSATQMYQRDGYTSGIMDTVSIRYRIDVSSTQPDGAYTNTVTYTGVMTP